MQKIISSIKEIYIFHTILCYTLSKSRKIKTPYMETNRTHFVQPGKIEIDANERAVTEKSQCCFFVCTIFDSFLNDLFNCYEFIYYTSLL